MKKEFKVKPLCAAIGATFAVTMAASPVANAADNPFELNAFESGYMVTAADKEAEGKCGEGKCGGEKDADSPCAKKAEGKCGEGKCGGDKANEGKCGEGKCGGDKAGDGDSMVDKAKETVKDVKDAVTTPLSPN